MKKISKYFLLTFALTVTIQSIGFVNKPMEEVPPVYLNDYSMNS